MLDFDDTLVGLEKIYINPYISKWMVCSMECYRSFGVQFFCFNLCVCWMSHQVDSFYSIKPQMKKIKIFKILFVNTITFQMKIL